MGCFGSPAKAETAEASTQTDLQMDDLIISPKALERIAAAEVGIVISTQPGTLDSTALDEVTFPNGDSGEASKDSTFVVKPMTPGAF